MADQQQVAREIARKSANMGMFGKHVEFDEAEAIKEAARNILAHELEEDEDDGRCYLHKVVIESLQRELDTVRTQLLYKTSARELELDAENKELKAQIARLEARVHWETSYGWTLPGAFILASKKDGECACSRERRLYGVHHSSAAGGSGGGGHAAAAAAGHGAGGDGSGPGGRKTVCARPCACGHYY